MKLVHKRILFLFLIFVILLFCVLLKVGLAISCKGEYYIERAYDLWTRNIPVSYHRGKILDRNGNVIVTNKLSPSLSIIPKQIENKEYTINALSTILKVDKNTLSKHFDKNVSIEKINPEGKYLDLKVAKKILALDLKGVYLTSDVTRYYPYGNVLSHVLGIVGTDNQGLSGLEYVYDDILKGQKGSLNIFTDAHGKLMTNYEQMIENNAIACDIVLTIDINCQLAIEEAIENAQIQYDSDLAFGLIMNPKTSEILAMVSNPNFDLINYQDYDSTIFNRNLPIWMTYEYGSTFKFVTYTAGLEEKVFTTDESFYCKGFSIIDGTRIKDWKAGGHGQETFLEVIQNSCNPGFMEIGARLGKEKLFKYIKNYGFGKLTNVDLLGEAKGIIFKNEAIGNVELATSSFGQGNSGTAIQLVNACSCAVNGGYLHEPYIVKGISINDTVLYREKKTFVRTVISEETSQILCDALERVVSLGTARPAYIEGYRVGGKTGTAQIPENGSYLSNTYILSFLGIAPMNDPTLACYIAIKAPKTYIQYGGVVVAPIVKDVLSSCFTILKIEKQEGGIPIDSRWYIDNFYYIVESYIGKSPKEVTFHPYYEIKIIGNGDKIIDQIPSANSKIISGGTVTLYTN